MIVNTFIQKQFDKVLVMDKRMLENYALGTFEPIIADQLFLIEIMTTMQLMKDNSYMNFLRVFDLEVN